MKVIKSISEMKSWSNAQRATSKTIGFVPTMGFLHEGHISLIKRAKAYTDCIVLSIFVNPKSEDVSVIFYPDDTEMYPIEHKTYVITEEIDQLLCGKSRPTHFKGVTTICNKLFNIVKPHFAVFGQKDAQQAILLKRMVNDLNMDVEIIVSPIVRERDGLAMSSRNKYLSSKERKEAAHIYKSLQLGKNEIQNKNLKLSEIKLKIQSYIEQNTSGNIDYIEIVDAKTLDSIKSFKKPLLIAIAVYFQKARLIDNLIIE
jgi:pantoate--beta-alanine ligase